jgi:hypothetical protein
MGALPTYSASKLKFLREQLNQAITTRQGIEFSDAFDSLERARLLKEISRTIAAYEKRIDAWTKYDRKYGEVLR